MFEPFIAEVPVPIIAMVPVPGVNVPVEVQSPFKLIVPEPPVSEPELFMSTVVTVGAPESVIDAPVPMVMPAANAEIVVSALNENNNMAGIINLRIVPFLLHNKITPGCRAIINRTAREVSNIYCNSICRCNRSALRDKAGVHTGGC